MGFRYLKISNVVHTVKNDHAILIDGLQTCSAFRLGLIKAYHQMIL